MQARRKQLNIGGAQLLTLPPPPPNRSQKHYLGVNIGGWAEAPLAPLFRRP